MASVKMDTERGMEFAVALEGDGQHVQTLGGRVGGRGLPEMPGAGKARAEALQREAASGLKTTATSIHGEARGMQVRVFLMIAADGADGLKGFKYGGDILDGGLAFWLNPRLFTKDGLLNLWKRGTGSYWNRISQFTKGFDKYLQQAGWGKKGYWARKGWIPRSGSNIDKVLKSPISRGAHKYIPIAGDAITATSVYGDEMAHGSSHAQAAAASAGAVAGSRGGAWAGAATGAALGAAVGGPAAPATALVGGVIGGIAGSEVGEHVGRSIGHNVSKVGHNVSKLKFW